MTYPVTTTEVHPTRRRTHEGRTVNVSLFPTEGMFGRPAVGLAAHNGSAEAIAEAVAEAVRALPGHVIKAVHVSPLRCFQSNCPCAFDTMRDVRVTR